MERLHFQQNEQMQQHDKHHLYQDVTNRKLHANKDSIKFYLNLTITQFMAVNWKIAFNNAVNR